MKYFGVLGLVLAGFSIAPTAKADTYNFQCITFNSPNCVANAAQFSVDVTDPGSGQVLFTFRNALNGVSSSIAQVYFADGTLLGIAAVNVGNIGNVDFDDPATPAQLPGGNSVNPAFVVTQGFSAGADNPAPQKGVAPGETLGIKFNLINGKTFADLIAAMNGPLGDGNDLRIGMHVIGFPGDYSDGFINTTANRPNEVVPEPASIMLLGSVAFGLALRFRRRFNA